MTRDYLKLYHYGSPPGTSIAGLAIVAPCNEESAMSPNPQGSFRIFRITGITIYLHWLWFVVAYLQIVQRSHTYSSISWNLAEYLALFGIVLLHEFGHAFATRQVGGTADTILLWPLGGVAYVSAPPRAGAQLWSIAAGPLVNVALTIPLAILMVVNHVPFFGAAFSDLAIILRNIWWINLFLLVFNLFPIYPLDGGQILRSLLWYPFGPVRSLLYASIIGFVGIVGLIALAFYFEAMSLWTGVMIFYIFNGCRAAFVRARALSAPPPLSSEPPPFGAN
jgi:Zn-dependent protease